MPIYKYNFCYASWHLIQNNVVSELCAIKLLHIRIMNMHGEQMRMVSDLTWHVEHAPCFIIFQSSVVVLLYVVCKNKLVCVMCINNYRPLYAAYPNIQLYKLVYYFKWVILICSWILCMIYIYYHYTSYFAYREKRCLFYY